MAWRRAGGREAARSDQFLPPHELAHGPINRLRKFAAVVGVGLGCLASCGLTSSAGARTDVSPIGQVERLPSLPTSKLCAWAPAKDDTLIKVDEAPGHNGPSCMTDGLYIDESQHLWICIDADKTRVVRPMQIVIAPCSARVITIQP